MIKLITLITSLLFFCSLSTKSAYATANDHTKTAGSLTYEDGLIEGYKRGTESCENKKEKLPEVVSSRCRCEGDKFGYVVRDIVYSDGSSDSHYVSSKIQLRVPFQKINCKKLIVEYCGI